MSRPGRAVARRVTAGVAGLGVAVSCLVVGAAPADAEVDTIVVTTTEDSGAGSLRAALAQAEASAADEHITFAPSVSGTIQLTSGQLEVVVGGATGNLTVEGPGADAIAVDAGGQSRVLDVRGLAGDTRPTLVVSGLTLSNGSEWRDDGGAVRSAGLDLTLDRVVVADSWAITSGGGVSHEGGSLLVTASTITRNAVDGDGDGGGILFQGGEAAGATLAVRDSTISGNTAGQFGGGIHATGSVPVTVTGSTVSGNRVASLVHMTQIAYMQGKGGGISADDLTVVDSRVTGNEAALHGGGLTGRSVSVTRSTLARNVAGERGGGVHVEGTGDGLRLQSSTVTDNRADVGGGLHVGSNLPVELTLATVAANAAVTGGGLFSTTEATLEGTIVAMNSGGDLAGDGSANLDHSLVRDPRIFPYDDIGGSIIGEDPLLGPLADNGGPTQTMRPASNSPVIDQGGAFGETTDQRGLPRPTDGADIGAVELTSEERGGDPQVENTVPPAITGGVRVGETLHTDGGSWAPEAEDLSYQWLRDGVPIVGATAASYTLTGDDFGRRWRQVDDRQRLSVRLTAAASGHLEGTMVSDYTGHVRKGLLTVSRHARVKGKPKVGSTLRAKPRLRAVSPRPTGVKIRWYLDGRLVRRATDDRRLELRPRMRGKRVKVTFVYRPPWGYQRLEQMVRKHRRVR